MAESVQDFFATLPARADSSKTAGMTNSYVFDIDGAGRWKTQEDQPARAVERIVLATDETPELRLSAERAALLAERTNRARDLANMPPNELDPAALAEHAAALAAEHEHLSATALDPGEMEELGMGALLAVGRGSLNE